MIVFVNNLHGYLTINYIGNHGTNQRLSMVLIASSDIYTNN
jgi:hypothetical protein